MAIAAGHPYWHIAKLVRQNNTIHTLIFSQYRYVPQSIVDERIPFFVSREHFLNESWMEYAFDTTPNDKELALHSKVLGYDCEWHIPMADMSTTAKAHLIKLQTLLEHTGFGDFEWFSSGRSFHGYGKQLLNHADWVRLMGALLLSNQKGMMPTVDPRWIGHRLLAGYSALRWTKNTSHYIDYPTSIPVL